MIESRIDTVRHENGEMQRYLVVSGFAWNDLDFVQAPFSNEAFSEICRIYGNFNVPKHSALYGIFLLFHVPEDIKCPYPYEGPFGLVFDRQLAAAEALRKLVRQGKIRNEDRTLVVDDPVAKAFLDNLERSGWLHVYCGDRSGEVNIMPIGEDLGFLSSVSPMSQMICNSHFFVMDVFDADSPYDLYGSPFGMTVRNGIMSIPPLSGREALVVDLDGKPSIARFDIRDIPVMIQGKTFRHGVNCTVYRRPEIRMTPPEPGLDVVVTGDEVAAFHEGGSVMVPTSGFVIHTDETLKKEPSPVQYLGFDDCLFAVQVGSSVVKDGKVMDHFESTFYDYEKDPVPYPPTLYPLDYERKRAPRLAICSDADGDPAIVWAEGPSKLGYRFGEESCGASLLELGQYCHSIGMTNALNLDGGGSAEIFMDGKLLLHVSGRNNDNTDAERPVPMGLMVR